MLAAIEQTVLSALQSIFDQFGWLGVFGLMIFENATGITPSEVILAFAGWMLIERHGISPSVIPLGGLYAGLGSAIGASITYWVARRGGRPLVDRFAKLFRIDLRYIERVEDQCRTWGAGIVLVGRVIPGVRTLVSIPAGLVRIPFPKFFAATFIGAAVLAWFIAWLDAGTLAGGIRVGFFAWLGFVVPVVTGDALFSGRDTALERPLFLIQAGHHLLALLVMGAVIGAWH